MAKYRTRVTQDGKGENQTFYPQRRHWFWGWEDVREDPYPTGGYQPKHRFNSLYQCERCIERLIERDEREVRLTYTVPFNQNKEHT